MHKASRHATPFHPGTGEIASMLSCVMVCCLLCVVMCCVLCVVWCGVFSQVQQSNTHYNTLHHTIPHCTTLFCWLDCGQPQHHLEAQHSLPSNTHCSTLQHTATHCNTLHRTATPYLTGSNVDNQRIISKLNNHS